MAKCGACGKFISQADGIKCDKFFAIYHLSCVSGAKFAKTTPWYCLECKKITALEKASVTPVAGQRQATTDSSPEEFLDASPITNTQQLASELKAELKLFKEEFIKTMRNELQVIRDDMAIFKASFNSRMADLEERVVAIEKKRETNSLASTGVDETIAPLKCELNERNQGLLGNYIEVANLPEGPNESPMHTVMLIAKKIGVNIEKRDIVSAERVGSRRINATEPASENTRVARSRRMIVCLARRNLHDEMLSNARARRGATSADLDLPGPPTRFYLNERLTKTNRLLFWKAREVGNQCGWKFVWSKRGRILARNKPGDPSHIIRSEADIQRIFGLGV